MYVVKLDAIKQDLTYRIGHLNRKQGQVRVNYYFIILFRNFLQ